jgi:pyruvate dehydrogenase E1 component beta subunit
MREISLAQAISETTIQMMEKNPNMFVIGEGVDDPAGIFGTTREAYLRFGAERVMDMPIAENGMTGVALGSAVMGMHPLLVFARTDFMLLAMDQIVNHAAKWHYTYGGKMCAPLTMRAIIGRGWGQGPQHSQSLQSLFVHIPGLKVVMPTTPYDAKGLLISCLEDKNPTIFIEHRWLHKEKGDVPEGYYSLPLGKAQVRKTGKDLTIVGISYGTLESLKAAEFLQTAGVDAEVIDLVSLKPWDKETVLASVAKTGRLMIVDTDWQICGMASEISAVISEIAFEYLKAPIKRIGLAEAPTPTSFKLEELYYPNLEGIISVALELTGKKANQDSLVFKKEDIKKFQGSF